MADIQNDSGNAGITSPGGFVFGVQGWTWGEPRPRSITFFLDGTAMVCDQHGRPIKGTSKDNKEVKFATTSPLPMQNGIPTLRPFLATHAQVIAALTSEGIDWQTLTCAGWPQLPYAQLKSMKELPATPTDDLRRIRDPQIRKDALRYRKEYEESRAKEMQPEDDE